MTSSPPRFSIVTAVYNVEPYLPDFIASIEAQAFDHGRIEVIAVDDGSTDGSLALLQAWAGRSPGMVTVLTKPNGGQGSARNLGLEHAMGEWVTFTDPDDMLDRDFLAVADRFAAAHPDVEVMAGRPLLLREAAGQVSDKHPRRRQFAAGSRVVDLDREPNTFTGSATVCLFRVDRIRSAGLRYDDRIRPSFEDGHFAVHFLMALPAPVIGILSDALYIYRKRAAGSSTLQRSMGHPGRYGAVLRLGYLEVLESARARYGAVPAWLQHVVIYELSWYFSEDEKISSTIRMAPELVSPCHDLIGRIVGHLQPEVIRAHTVRRMKSAWADILAHAWSGGDWHSSVVARTKVDPAMGLQRVSYRYTGTRPPEEFLLDGAPVRPAFGKVMAHSYLGRTLLHERIAWLPDRGTPEVRLDGRPVAIVDGWPRPDRPGRPSGLPRARRVGRKRGRGRGPAVRLARAARRWVRRWRASLAAAAPRLRSWLATAPLRLLAGAWPHRSMFRDAWVVMDRIHDADDNGERLFEHLLAERPDINAWFVLEKGTPDWRRMRAAGVPRLVAHGSLRWTMLLLNCSWLLSSHADVAITAPSQILRIAGRPTWKFAFLQHGVIKDDLSTWLNGRGIDLFVASTPPELQSIVADGTCYEFTAKEARLTGLPRFDRLLAKGNAVSPDDRDLLIVAPTWRRWLTDPLDPVSLQRAVGSAFWDSDYLASWLALLQSQEIARAAARRGWRVGFMPHPNFQSMLPRMELPAHVEPLAFAGTDVQALYARCALLVTDYSSVAFNVAYVDSPVVYFQFDRDEVLGGGHVGRRGYFDYLRDGFGPVATGLDEAVAAIVASIESGPRATPEYQARIDRTFVNRDGRACARVVAAVEELSRPYLPPDERGVPPDERGVPPAAGQGVG